MPREVDVQPTRTGRTLRIGEFTHTLVGEGDGDRKRRFAPSRERSEEDRERRHRERAIAAWLRDLGR